MREGPYIPFLTIGAVCGIAALVLVLIHMI
jgi:hypothetical protein